MMPSAPPRPPRTGLLLAPQPGRTIDVFAQALGLPGQMLVTVCEDTAGRLARCPRTGRLVAVLQPEDVVIVSRGGVRHVVEAGWTSLPDAGADLTLVCEPVGPSAVSAG